MNPRSWSRQRSDCSSAAVKLAMILLAAMAAGMSGCGSGPQTKYYELTEPNAPATAATGGDPLPVTLLVAPLRASHLYREDRLVYATSNEEMGTYQIHRWTEPPVEMVQELLWRSLRASNRYSSVYLLSSSAHGDYVVQGNLYDFKEISGGALAARVNLDVSLREVKTGTIVWTHAYSHDEPVSGKGVPAVAEALDRNIQRCVSETTASLNEYFSTRLKK